MTCTIGGGRYGDVEDQLYHAEFCGGRYFAGIARTVEGLIDSTNHVIIRCALTNIAIRIFGGRGESERRVRTPRGSTPSDFITIQACIALNSIPSELNTTR